MGVVEADQPVIDDVVVFQLDRILEAGNEIVGEVACSILGVAAVAVGHVAESGYEEGRGGGGIAGLGADEEWDMVDSVPGLEPSGIDPAFHSFRYGELEVNVPTGVVQIVVVEVDRAVFVGAQRKGVVPTGPVVAGHAPGRSIDRAAMKRMHRVIRGPSRADVLRKVPIPDQAAPEGRGLCPPLER